MSNSGYENYRDDYIARINRVLDYIEKNLQNTLSLETLANQAHLSKFHFHRIFKSLVGETLGQFILRIRLERAARELISDPQKPITVLCLDLGFSGSAIFARNFRALYGMSPSQWRNGGHKEYSKKNKPKSNNHQIVSKKWQEYILPHFYIDPRTRNQVWRINMKQHQEVKVEVKELPEMHVAYIRHTGPYKGDGALFERLYSKLCQWAGPRNLLQSPETKFLTIYHDDPDITDEEKLRLSVSITIPAEMKVDGEFGKMTVAAGKYGVGSFEIAESDEYQEAWTMMMAGWLPGSGFQPDDRFCFELYRNDSNSHPEGKHKVDICVPIKAI